jgi:lysophospholipid acyltransferase
MVLIMKLHALAWNYHDGRMKPELLTESQKERAVRRLPEFLDYAGYCFFFPSIFTGPAFDVSLVTRDVVGTDSFIGWHGSLSI